MTEEEKQEAVEMFEQFKKDHEKLCVEEMLIAQMMIDDLKGDQECKKD